MMLAYPSNWYEPVSGPTPYYLVCDEKAFALTDAMTVNNFARVGIPRVALPEQDLTYMLQKLDPSLES